MIVLGIETSCDETAASICKDGEIVSSIVNSQEIHRLYGGVVPELASQEHDANINCVINLALKDANLSLNNIDCIAVTYGAGLLGSLLVGLNYAKGLAIGLDIPFLGVNHLEGHLFASFISHSNIKYPFICLLVTGGHTQIWEVKEASKYKLYSTTIDDAAGEAFDKGARILGLGYPGGPEIEKKAKLGNPNSYSFTKPFIKKEPLNFSFSGLKTSILYKVREIGIEKSLKDLHNIAASYQETIIDVLLDRLDQVIYKTKIKNVTIVGGVAANKRFRYKADLMSKENYLNIYFPPIKYCTDNAAMIAIAGYQKLKQSIYSPLTLEAKPNLTLDNKI